MTHSPRAVWPICPLSALENARDIMFLDALGCVRSVLQGLMQVLAEGHGLAMWYPALVRVPCCSALLLGVALGLHSSLQCPRPNAGSYRAVGDLLVRGNVKACMEEHNGNVSQRNSGGASAIAYVTRNVS